MKKRVMSLFALLMLLGTMAAMAAVPTTINYQGKLTDSSGNPVTATPDMTFSLYTVASGGTAIWSETQTGVSVTNGIFNVELGSVSPISSSTLTQADLWLGINVAGDGEMTPRQKLTSAPFSVKSSTADTASALAANGTNCSSGQYPLGVDASGNAEGCTAVSSGSSTVMFSGGGVDLGGTGTVFISPVGHSSKSTISDTVTAVSPVSCSAKNLYVNEFHYNSGTAGSRTVTLTVDAPGTFSYSSPTLTTLTCTVSNIAAQNATTSCSDTSHSVSINAGDYIALEVASTGITGGTETGFGVGGDAEISFGFICQ